MKTVDEIREYHARLTAPGSGTSPEFSMLSVNETSVLLIEIATLRIERDCYRAARRTWPENVQKAISAGDVEACKVDGEKRHANWEELHRSHKAAEIRAERLRLALLHFTEPEHADADAQQVAAEALAATADDDARWFDENWERCVGGVEAQADQLAKERDELQAKLNGAEQRAAALQRENATHAMERARLNRWVEGIGAERDKLQAFKKYVHDRLDAAGVPANPEAEQNAKHGCRIEGRLNFLIGQRDLLSDECDTVAADLNFARAESQLANAHLADAIHQRDECAAEAQRLREALEHFWGHARSMLPASWFATYVQPFLAPTPAAAVFTEQLERVKAEARNTVKAPKPAEPSQMVGGLRQLCDLGETLRPMTTRSACPCGGPLEPKPAPTGANGKTYDAARVPLVPTCAKCGEQWFDAKATAAWDAAEVRAPKTVSAVCVDWASECSDGCAHERIGLRTAPCAYECSLAAVKPKPQGGGR